MHLPIKPLDFDITSSRDIAVDPEIRFIRVLARWNRTPIGILDVPVMGGKALAAEIKARVATRFPRVIARELVRRALLEGSIREKVRLVDHWHNSPVPRSGPLPTVSIAVCTRDRPDDLEDCLRSISLLSIEPHEVLVVDNAPATGATKNLVTERYPQFSYICEEQPGLDHARNRAISIATGDVIAFTDDDVRVDSDWLLAVSLAFAAEPRLGLLTGLIEPVEQETPAQVWFERYGGFGRGCIRHYFQLRSGAPMSWSMIGAGQLGAGANMAMRREVFDQIGRFDPALDVGTPTRGGGDHEIFFRLLRSGWICLYEPTAVVRHRHRRTMDELRNLLYNYGYATRCFFEREIIEFPGDRSSINRLTRWWWLHWAFARLVRATLCPDRFPVELIRCEIRGFIDGRGGYLRSRKSIVHDESIRPDRFNISLTPSTHLRKVGFATVQIDRPLRELCEGSLCEELDVMVRWRGRILGRFRMSTMGCSVSASRLADTIAGAMGGAILGPAASSADFAWCDYQAELGALLDTRATTTDAGPYPSVSVIVATCNRPDSLRNCLKSLVEVSYGGDWEIIVVDNRPQTDTAFQVVKDFPEVRLIREERTGSSYARNAGVAAARGEIIAMTDDDMRVAPDWLQRLVEPFMRADVLAVTGNTLAASLESAAERDFEKYGGFSRGFSRIEFTTAWLHQDKLRAAPTWKIGGSGNVAFRSTIFREPEIGAFLVTLGAGVPAGVGEDTMIFYQILRAGGTIIYEPSAIAWHHHRVKNGELRRQIFAYSKGHIAYHLLTLRKFRDRRALTRIFAEVPISVIQRSWQRLRGRNNYPWVLLATELAGTLLGPWSLWRSRLHVRKLGPGPRLHVEAGNYRTSPSKSLETIR